jgi:hypothetical protein
MVGEAQPAGGGDDGGVEPERRAAVPESASELAARLTR